MELNPGDSVFVASKEVLNLPSDMTAQVLLRNSRIRQGLSLDAPLYFPGHHTRVFYRVTNVSADSIALDAGRGIAQLVFEPVAGAVDAPYEGAFSDELDYRGLGRYQNVYAADMHRIADKAEEIKGIEKRMYGNVLALMAIFAAIFTLVNVNVQTAGWELAKIITMNLATVGSFAFLVGLITVVLKPQERWQKILPWVLAALAFASAIAVAVLV
ncbi:dCTP deaminase domain-containing protein [Bifidobacterium oedipodis]|uniref:dCTP deaminase domain-containing protein n=1 Tax=Bifidobacterium oedipodis TaxID=2675322 RepID=UPI00145D5B0E|nr:hypothetical protein [Bifidobacterium sp. DSM 109957]